MFEWWQNECPALFMYRNLWFWDWFVQLEKHQDGGWFWLDKKPGRYGDSKYWTLSWPHPGHSAGYVVLYSQFYIALIIIDWSKIINSNTCNELLESSLEVECSFIEKQMSGNSLILYLVNDILFFILLLLQVIMYTSRPLLHVRGGTLPG